MEILALIPARGGSKSIPRKNIKPFAGSPLIAYSIGCALASNLITRTIVSTDDDEIASIALNYGAETPFLRPSEFSKDTTTDLPVFKHALQWLKEHEGYQPEIVVQLRPTSPLRKVSHVDHAIQKLIDHPQADSVRTVCEPFQNPFKMWKINPNGYLSPLIESEIEKAYNMPRQLLPTVYWQTGYVDVFWSDTVLRKDSLTGDMILPLIISAEDWIDIDSVDDWRRAERLLENNEISLESLGFNINTP